MVDLALLAVKDAEIENEQGQDKKVETEPRPNGYFIIELSRRPDAGRRSTENGRV